MGRASLLTLTFGLFFFDYDLDGLPDIFAANGHIEEDINRVQPKVRYKESPLLFHNLGSGKFDEVSAQQSPEFQRPIVARGAAYADFDHDGDLDIVVSTNHGPGYLFRNDGGNRNQWIHLTLKGTKSNRSAIGAVVHLKSAGGRQMQMVHSGSSYCSQSELGLTFGLGRDKVIDSIEIDWPSGVKQRLTGITPNQYLTIQEK